MHRHANFDLLLHNDVELSRVLGQTVIRRETLHQWPLSSVERLWLADGSTHIYKAGCQPTFEAEFYAAARSPLLVETRLLYQDEHFTCLLLEDLHLNGLDGVLDAREAPEVGRSLLAAIARIEGEPPVYLELSHWQQWLAWAERLDRNLHLLAADWQFQHTTRAAIDRLASWARSAEVQAVWNGPVGLVHNDLTTENIFVGADGWRIIDWQRPARAPVIVDMVDFLLSAGVDPLPYSGLGAVRLRHLLRAGWLVDCCLRWFPPGIAVYDREIAALAAHP